MVVLKEDTRGEGEKVQKREGEEEVRKRRGGVKVEAGEGVEGRGSMNNP